MRRSFIAALALLSQACGLVTFDLTVSGDTTVPKSNFPLNLTGIPALSGFTGMDFSQSQEFQNRGVRKEHVTSVKLTRFALQITAPNDQDFKFLDRLEVHARSSGLPDVLVADKQDISSLSLSAPNPTLELDTKDAELQPYVVAPSMDFIVSGTGRQPTKDTSIRGTAVMKVVVR